MGSGLVTLLVVTSAIMGIMLGILIMCIRGYHGSAKGTIYAEPDSKGLYLESNVSFEEMASEERVLLNVVVLKKDSRE